MNLGDSVRRIWICPIHGKEAFPEIHQLHRKYQARIRSWDYFWALVNHVMNQQIKKNTIYFDEDCLVRDVEEFLRQNPGL